MCVYVRFRFFIIPYRGGRQGALSSATKTDQADFTDWMSFLSYSLMKDISFKTEALGANN